MEHIFLTEIDILQVRHLKNIKIKLSRDETLFVAGYYGIGYLFIFFRYLEPECLL